MENMPGIARFEGDGTSLSAHKLPIMKPAKVTSKGSKGHGVRVEGSCLCVILCQQSTRKKLKATY
jgi:hypothetical protein